MLPFCQHIGEAAFFIDGRSDIGSVVKSISLLFKTELQGDVSACMLILLSLFPRSNGFIIGLLMPADHNKIVLKSI
jgi:hypothetical protein